MNPACLFVRAPTTDLVECMRVYMREGDGTSCTHSFDSFGFGVQSRVCCSGLTGLLLHVRTWKLMGPV